MVRSTVKKLLIAKRKRSSRPHRAVSVFSALCFGAETGDRFQFGLSAFSQNMIPTLFPTVRELQLWVKRNRGYSIYLLPTTNMGEWVEMEDISKVHRS